MPVDPFREELEYLYEYAKMGILYFVPVWDSAEIVAGEGASIPQVRAAALKLIGAMIDRGVEVGEISSRPDRDIERWELSKEEILRRIDEGTKERRDPLDFIYICGFRVGADR
ncbi:hypothetical protein [Streptomyces zingiberis]|uniref:Uncharacterized protein n=1 Tax=Streptomyces zingiberis TaxID=2053010 RepID=A0ABX1C542_9ACTN|nr:hypothetical protein [Streptomyces zingiberis]NJQ02059.1 hypothetical protein [Streptomyces zingiberis]